MKVSAIIVTYNPDTKRLDENVKAVLPQVEQLFIVDNGSQNNFEICESYASIENIDIIRLRKNKGIAYALNRGCEAAEKFSDWVITLDQDSVVPDNLVKEYAKFVKLPNIGIIAPRTKYKNGFIENDFHNSEHYVEIEKCISSANMVKLSSWKAVGGFDEKMFIDYVDFDFCASLREHGYKILLCENVVLDHELGKAQQVKKFPFSKSMVNIYNHSPKRTYYYTRNALYYIRKHKKSHVINVFVENKILIRWLGIKLIYERNRWQCMKSIIKGFVDGLKMEV